LWALRDSELANPQIVVPAARAGARTAFSTLTARADWPAVLKQGRMASKRFWRCIDVLEQEQLVGEQVWMRADRHKTMRLVLTEKGVRWCLDNDK
jgi:hypothetical protein